MSSSRPGAGNKLEAGAAGYSVSARLLAYLKPLWFAFTLSIVGYMGYSYTSVQFAELTGVMVDAVESADTLTPAERLAIPLTLMLIVIFRGIGSFFGSYYLAYVANHLVHRLRCQIFDRFLCIPVSYYDSNTSGHLLSKITYNVNQISLAVTDAMTVILREGLLVLGLIIYLFILNWQLTLFFLCVMPLIALVAAYASKKFRKHSKRMQISMGDVTHILSETIKGMRVVRSFVGENHARSKFTEASERNLKQNLKMASTQAISTPVIQVLVAGSLSILLWLAMNPASLADISPGEFVAYIVAAGMLLRPIRQLSKINSVVQRGLAAAESVFEVLNEAGEPDRGTYETDRIQGKISFQNVGFAYPGKPHAPVIRELSFTCEPGRSIAIVGHSGSGKSTLVNLIPRFYVPTSGCILVDDIPQSDYRLQNLRQHIALVSQQVVLFNGSIRENVAYGSLEAVSDEAVCTALINANAMEFIEQLEDGINTLVGDDGITLSGGQRQRLAIARALLKDAPVLILDEATSSLDSVSERYIQAALETLMQGRTTFVIAHRLSTIENADYILVMKEGRVVEQGTHDQLLALGGHYAELHRMQ
ncbi:MAG: lipid A export permease/ATP-binding protein MsbA, partial [Pseudohongiellaceae bacterium]